jgi:hypothetical protein
MPVIETVGVVAESASLLLELSKIIRAGISEPWSKDGFRILSSLTTLEFRYANGKQIAHFVQDRQVFFTKAGGLLPPFYYSTEGEDTIEELLIDEMPQEFEVEKSPGNPTSILPRKPHRYEKNYAVSMTLIARSINAFTKPRETYSLRVAKRVGKSQVTVVFPNDKKPVGFGLYYRQKKDETTVRRQPTYKTWFLRKTTYDRWILYWELNNAKLGNTYTLEWTWP